jgi:PPOX class probable F420-dependent enzyme
MGATRRPTGIPPEGPETPMTAPAPPPGTFQSLAGERFVALTTFRRSGAAVTTPVWIAGVGDALVVTTPAASGKVKRLRNSGRVQLQPCGRSGKVAPGAPTVEGSAVILGPDTAHPNEASAIRRKYGLEYRVIVAIEAISRRVRKQTAERLILRISAPGAAN